jgi:protein-S-isoprenylcysteine O-methyltransferase Ste14
MAHSTWKGFWIGIIFVVLGQAIRMWAAGHLVKCDDLTTSGPFGWVRNPLYVGSFLIACGYCTISGGWIVWAVAIPLFALTHGSAVTWEEKYMLQTYGDAFAGYCKSVPRWMPRPPRRREPGKRFSWPQMVINAELKSLIVTAVVVAIFAARLYFGK